MEQRLNFSDYSAAEQDRDARKTERKNRYEIYIMRVNGDWGAVMPCKRHNLIFNADKGVELTEFVTDLKEDFEKWGWKANFHCIRNFGIESKIAEHQYDFDKLINNEGR